MIIAGIGDDSVLIDHDCQVIAGEVVDGGPGNDTIRSHRSLAELAALGLTIVSVEHVVTVVEASHSASACSMKYDDDGPMLRPQVSMSWSELTGEGDVLSTPTGVLTLALRNISDAAVDVGLEFILRVRGEEIQFEKSPITIPPEASMTTTLDLHDFIPLGIDIGNVDPTLLVLPTSASIRTRARLSVGGVYIGHNFPPTLFAHIEDGTTVVVYRAGALHSTYHHGDLAGWRTGVPSYSGSAVLMGHSEAHGSLGIPGF